MSNEPWDAPLEEVAPDEVAFDYVKAHDFRVVWADGAIGGITPGGLIHFALYSERPAIPRRQVFLLQSDGDGGQKLGPELPEKRLSRDSIVREMACDVFLDVSSAEQLGKWLLERVNERRQASEE